MPEPRDPLLKVLTYYDVQSEIPRRFTDSFPIPLAGARPRDPPWKGWGRAPARAKRPPLGPPAEATITDEVRDGLGELLHSLMIPPLVHQRRPCYDFYFL